MNVMGARGRSQHAPAVPSKLHGMSRSEDSRQDCPPPLLRDVMLGHPSCRLLHGPSRILPYEHFSAASMENLPSPVHFGHSFCSACPGSESESDTSRYRIATAAN